MPLVLKSGSLFFLQTAGLVEARSGFVSAFRRPGLATGWTVRGSKFGVGEYLRTRPDRPWVPPSLLDNGYRVSFPGVKRPERGVDHPPHLAPRLTLWPWNWTFTV